MNVLQRCFTFYASFHNGNKILTSTQDDNSDLVVSFPTSSTYLLYSYEEGIDRSTLVAYLSPHLLG